MAPSGRPIGRPRRRPKAGWNERENLPHEELEEPARKQHRQDQKQQHQYQHQHQRQHPKSRSLGKKWPMHTYLFVFSLVAVMVLLLILNIKILNDHNSANNTSDFKFIRVGNTNTITKTNAKNKRFTTLADNPFCNSLKGALAKGSEDNRTMIHAFVSNSGHLPFLRNALLSMHHSAGISWTPLVLSIGAGVCPVLTNMTVVCVPYLDRLLDQLQRDEPESVAQIQPFLLDARNENENDADNPTSKNNGSSSTNQTFHTIDQSYYKWGAVGHKFVTNAKLYALRDIMECGADAFITDTDIGFRRDPRQYFAIPGPKGDIVAQNDTNPNVYQLNLNSGFMYWKSTRENLDLINDIIKVPPFWHFDQSRMNTIMHNHSTPHTILDSYKFPNGHMITDHFEDLDGMVVLHANWNNKQSEKEEMLQKAGLWFLNEK